MIKFYFQYDKDRHKAKFVVIEEGGHQDIYFVDKIICKVDTFTVRQDESPKFSVHGECEEWQLDCKFGLISTILIQ